MKLSPTLAMAFAAIAIASLALWLSAKKSSVVDLAEFSRLDGQLKSLYRDTVVDFGAPALFDAVNQEWVSLPSEARDKALAQAREAAKRYGAMAKKQIASTGGYARRWFSSAPKPRPAPRPTPRPTPRPMPMPRPPVVIGGPGSYPVPPAAFPAKPFIIGDKLIAVPNQTASGKKESFESDTYML